MKRILFTVLLPFSAFGQNPVVPVLNVLIPDQSGTQTDPTVEVASLADHFGMEEIRDQAVRLTAEWQALDGTPGTTNFDFLLFRNRTPITVTNLLGYVNRGDYTNMAVHRLVRNFVIQGGGFTVVNSATGPQTNSVTTQDPIMNEFGVSNTLGTLSMAKLGGNPDSATSQWFVSMGANSDNLDFQNGGFTVFGRISKDTFTNAKALNDGPVFTPFNLGGAFAPAPLVSGTTNETFTAERFFRFASAAEVPLPAGQAGIDTELTYSIVSQTGIDDITGSISGADLTLEFSGPTRRGQKSFVIQAEDSVGNQVVDTFVAIKRETYAEWRLQEFSMTDSMNDEVSGPNADPNGDGVINFEVFVRGLSISGNHRDSAWYLNMVSSTVVELETGPYLGGVDFILESSSNLDDWDPVEGATPTVTENALRTLVRFDSAFELSVTPKAFYRVRPMLK